MSFSLENKSFVIEENLKKELIQKYGREMKCGDCFWFSPSEGTSDYDDEDECCSLYGHMSAGINFNTSACSKFELKAED